MEPISGKIFLSRFRVDEVIQHGEFYSRYRGSRSKAKPEPFNQSFRETARTRPVRAVLQTGQPDSSISRPSKHHPILWSVRRSGISFYDREVHRRAVSGTRSCAREPGNRCFRRMP